MKDFYINIEFLIYLKLEKKLKIILSLILLLTFCVFRVIYAYQSQNIVKSISGILRNESVNGNTYALSKSISDLERMNLLSCVKLIERSDEIKTYYDTSKQKKCSQNILLNFFFNTQIEIIPTNGLSYNLNFIPEIPISLILLELFTYLFLSLMFYLFYLNEKSKEKINDLKMQSIIELEKIALQVSHDIRSPVAALKIAIGDNDFKDTNNTLIIKSALHQIEEIADNLLKKKNDNQANEVLVVPLLKSIILEKKMELKNQNFEIVFNENDVELKTTVKINQQHFKRTISNLINNAYEALVPNRKGKIFISIETQDNNFLLIKIKDNGCGIPEDIIHKIGTRGFSYNKESKTNSGNGLGLSHAFDTIKSFGGHLIIESKENEGTEIKLFLPFTIKESVAVINSNEVTNIPMAILVDDDELIRVTWASRATKAGIDFIAYSNSADLFKNLHLLSTETVFYLDSELKQEKGEDIAKKLFDRGYKNLYLTTGHSKDNFIQLDFILDILSKNPPFQQKD